MEERLKKSEWGNFCESCAKTHHGHEARIEIIGRAFGHREEAAWMPFSGISYDDQQNQIFITLGGMSSKYPAHLTHMIEAPKMLHVIRSPEGTLKSVLIVSADKMETLLHLREQAPPQT